MLSSSSHDMRDLSTDMKCTVMHGNVDDTLHPWSACECIVERCPPEHTSFPRPNENSILIFCVSYFDAARYVMHILGLNYSGHGPIFEPLL